MNSGSNRRYQFGEFTLDVADRRLERDGQEIHLQPKTFDTLVYLIEHRGQVVQKKELLDTLWAGTYVTENALTRCVKEARKALDDDAADPRYIQTVSRVGYRFIATTRELGRQRSITPQPRGIPKLVEELSADLHGNGPAPKRRRRSQLLIASTVLAAIGVALAVWMQPPAQQEQPPPAYNTIAVLPFVNMSDDPANEYFSDGVSEDLLNKLAELPDLRVSARTSSFFFKGKQVDIPTIADRLDVATIVEGSVRRHGDKVRITAQLIDAADGYHLWSDTYDRELGDIFEIQDEIADAIARALQTKLPSGSSGSRIHTPGLEAYQLYLRGREAINRRPAGWISRSVEYFSRAIEADPGFAEPYAARAIANGISILRTGKPDIDEEFLMVRKALELEPDLPEAHAALGLLYMAKSDFVSSENAFRRALELNPNFSSARSWLVNVLNQTRRFAEGAREMEKAFVTDPLNPLVNVNIANHLARSGNYDDALALLRGWLEDPPAPPLVDHEFARVNHSFGHYDRSMAWAQYILSDHPEWSLPRVYIVSDYSRLGDFTRAAEALDALEQVDNRRAILTRAEYLLVRGDIAGLKDHVRDNAGRWESGHGTADENWSLTYWRGISSLLTGDSEAAVESLRWIHRIQDQPIPRGMFVIDEVEFLLWLSIAQRENADLDLASESAARALAICEDLSVQGFASPNFLRVTAQAHALLGDREAAITTLTDAVDLGWRDYRSTVHDPRWDSVRGDERFAALMRRVESDLEIMRERVELAAANDDWQSLRSAAP